MASRVVPDIAGIPAGRTVDFTWAAYLANGTTAAAFAVGDKVRFKLARRPGGTPILDLLSGTATAAGSVVAITGTSPAAGTVRLGQADTATFEGEYHFELNHVDDSETAPADAIKPICRGKLKFTLSQGGNVGLS